MGFWGAVEETVVGGAAGAVGLAGAVPVYGHVADAAAGAIHGIDAAAHLVAGDTETAAREGGSAVAALVPYVGVGMAAGDLVQAGYNGANAATGGHEEGTGHMINHWLFGD